jgi:hypothetical protein
VQREERASIVLLGSRHRQIVGRRGEGTAKLSDGTAET